MHRRSIQIVTAAAMAAVAGQAIAQHQMSPSESRLISQKLQEANKSLIDAVQLAERETGGKALAAEIMTSSALQGIYGRRTIIRPDDEPDPRRDADREPNPDMDRQRDQDRQRQNRDVGADPREQGLHASVTCLVNETQLRRVIVDLEEGRVVQSRAMGAGDDSRMARQGDMSASDATQMQLASDAINANVVNAQSEDLGDIDDLALDVSSGQVRYAVVRSGGVLGMGGDRHAVPLGALTFMSKDEVRLDMTKDQLDQREGFDNDRWPQQPTGAWGGAGAQGERPGQDRPDRQQRPDRARPDEEPQVQRPGQPAREMSATVEKASDVIGAAVHGAGDASFGDVDDIVIKPSDSSIAHYIIATGDGKVAVAASKVQMSNRRLTLDMEQPEFDQLPKFRDNENPDWTNPSWLRDNENRRDRDPQRRDERDPARRGGG
jgi:sporulation protein YlmC with PRC-barrel domain